MCVNTQSEWDRAISSTVNNQQQQQQQTTHNSQIYMRLIAFAYFYCLNNFCVRFESSGVCVCKQRSDKKRRTHTHTKYQFCVSFSAWIFKVIVDIHTFLHNTIVTAALCFDHHFSSFTCFVVNNANSFFVVAASHCVPIEFIAWTHTRMTEKKFAVAIGGHNQKSSIRK